MAQQHSRNSFLKNAGLRGSVLDINYIPKIPKSRGDDKYEIESRYENRPDLLANKLYGSVNLWWVFAARNPDQLIDPLEDFTAGKVIYTPTLDTINTILR